MIDIFNKGFDFIEAADIRILIDIGYKEDQKVEYKREMYGGSPDNKKEMLKDISAFANAYGGILLIGIEEKGGIPRGVFHVSNAEVERDRIEKSCMGNIEPRISGLKCKVIKMNTGEDIILVYITRSFRKPHIINYKDLNQFWIRHNDKKMLMAIEEIRDACLQVESMLKKVDSLLEDRRVRIQLTHNNIFVLGAAPILCAEDLIDIKVPEIKKFLINPPNQADRFNTLSFAFQGVPQEYPFPTINGLKISLENSHTVQLFSNGYYELMVSLECLLKTAADGRKLIDDAGIISYVVNYFRALSYLVDHFGVDMEMAIFAGLFQVSSHQMQQKEIVPETNKLGVPIKEYKGEGENIFYKSRHVINTGSADRVAKHLLEKLWNAFGFEIVPYFDGNKYDPNLMD